MAVFPKSTAWKLLLLHIFIAYEFYNPTDSGAVQLTTANLKSTIAKYETGFINFYADWCQFSRKLAPEFDQAADELAVQYANQSNKVIMAKVDCDAESDASSIFQITKFPTLKVILNGKIWRSEYRGRRVIEAFKKHVEDLLNDPCTEFFSLKELENLDDKKRMLIGYFDRKDSPEYDTFRRVSSYFRHDCQSYVGFGLPNITLSPSQIDASVHMHPPGQPIVVFRPDKATSPERDETFSGDATNYDELEKWAADKCVPLVREITFDNAEELTEESLPFLILFHRQDDTASVKKYKEVIQRELVGERGRVNFLTADGARFAHPLRHLGMEQKDLPLIAIDSFRHMYLFRDFSKVDEPGRLKQFLNDLYSGKLHREYHYGPDPDRTEEPVKAISPPESAFKNLAPSDNRYSLLRDEL